MSADSFLWLVPFGPMTATAVVLLLGRRVGRQWGLGLALAATVVSVCELYAAGRVLMGLPPLERHLEQVVFQWMSVGEFILQPSLRLDGLVLPVSGAILLVALAVQVYALSSQGSERWMENGVLAAGLGGAAVLVAFSDDLLGITAAAIGTSIAVYLMGRRFSEQALISPSRVALFSMACGDGALFAAAAIAYTCFGSTEPGFVVAEVERSFLAQPTAVLPFVGLIAFAVWVRAGLPPFHLWMRDTAGYPASAAALIQSVAVSGTSVYLVLRLRPLLDLAFPLPVVLAVVAALGALWSAVAAARSRSVRLALSHSTVSQNCFIMLAALLDAGLLAVCLLAAHAVGKALMWLSSAGLEPDEGKALAGGTSGLARAGALSVGAFWVGGIGLIGVSGAATLFALPQVLQAAVTGTPSQLVWWAIAVLGAGVTSCYACFLSLRLSDRRGAEVRGTGHQTPTVQRLALAILLLGGVGGVFFARPYCAGERLLLARLLEPKIVSPPPLVSSQLAGLLVGLVAVAVGAGALTAAAMWRRGYLPGAGPELGRGLAAVSARWGARLKSLPINLGDHVAGFLGDAVLGLEQGGGLMAFPDCSARAFALAVAIGLAFAVVLLR